MRTVIVLAMLVGLVAGTSVGQEVEIQSFGSSGQLTWIAPSNSDCTIEWTSQLASSGVWERTWSDLRNITCTNATSMASVPMFYRVTCWTNGLFLRLPAGRTFVYGVSNALGQTWTEEFAVVAEATFPAMTNNYQLLVISQHWEGAMPEGASEEVESVFVRSTGTSMYNLDYLNEAEFLDWRKGTTGTTWTVDYGGGDSNDAEIASIETVNVPAGTFTECIKIHKHGLNTAHPKPDWYEWIKPGFFMVRWVDYWEDNTNATPIVYELQSWHDGQ